MWRDVYADFTDLLKHEQQKLFDLIKEEFFSDADEEMKDAFWLIESPRSVEGEIKREGLVT